MLFAPDSGRDQLDDDTALIVRLFLFIESLYWSKLMISCHHGTKKHPKLLGDFFIAIFPWENTDIFILLELAIIMMHLKNVINYGKISYRIYIAYFSCSSS